eukprot:tig00000144_g9103.t1
MQRAFFVAGAPIPRGLRTAAARPLAAARVGLATRASAGGPGAPASGRRGDGEQRPIDKAREASMARSHEEKSAAARKAAETRAQKSAGERAEEHKHRVEGGRKAAEHRDPDEMTETLEYARDASQSRSHEEKSEAAKKAWETRRAHELKDEAERPIEGKGRRRDEDVM